MRTLIVMFAVGLTSFWAGCASRVEPADAGPPMRPGGPNWAEVDKTVQRVKEREANKGRLVETSRSQETGFSTMSDADYTAALDAARDEVKKANPKWTEGQVEGEATKRADEAKWKYEHAVSSSASSSYEWKKP